MQLTLIHPPFDDPTLPYHSTAYLAGHLRHSGIHQVSTRDLNIEFIDYALEEETILSFYQDAEMRACELNNRTELTFVEQEQLYSMLVTPRIPVADIHRARAVMRNKVAFLNYDNYGESVRTMVGYFGFLGALSYPAEIVGCTQKTRGRYSVFSVADLLDPALGSAVCRPFERYFEQRLVHDPGLLSSDMIGISIIYDHQIFCALHLARLLKRTWPSKRVILGGTAITQSYKYMAQKSQMKHLFSLCDAVVVGEGESAICEIMSSGDLSGKQHFTNTITYDRQRDELYEPTIRYENVNALGRPHYDYRWDLYLAPERGINYSPTRGCYWNKCTFCDYGLNTDKPTSPWRERSIDKVIADLLVVTQEQGVKYVYFAVDVMSPAYLERISDALIATRLDIRWGAELRMEKVFTAERCQKLKRAGCTCISFGMESGNQRVLDLIDKGTKVEFMAKTMKNVAEAGIAVQLMTFTDFPTETHTEKQATFDFIRNNSEYWAGGGIATFLLTGTSIIARNPERFGLTLIEPQNVDIRRAICYKVNQETNERVALTEECDASFGDPGEIFPVTFDRPWAGGNDTLHSMIYYSAYDRNFFKRVCARHAPPTTQTDFPPNADARIVINGTFLDCPFDLTEVLWNRARFKTYVGQVIQSASEPTAMKFAEWQKGIPVLPQKPETFRFWLSTGKYTVRLSTGLYQILKRCKTQPTTLPQACALLPANLKDKFLQLIRGMVEGGLVSLIDPASSALLLVNEDQVSRKSRQFTHDYSFKIETA